jgi:predicted O-methyltransferase YrrM
MGASLGITSSYLALGTNWEKFITIEGSPGIAERARENFDGLQLRHIELREGNFDQELSTVLGQFSSIDFIFVDGNHRKEPTVRYFRQLLAKSTTSTIMVFDDIHWSPEMEKAWTIIRSDERVRCSIDLFFIGILFFREEFKEKQDFTIRF